MLVFPLWVTGKVHYTSSMRHKEKVMRLYDAKCVPMALKTLIVWVYVWVCMFAHARIHVCVLACVFTISEYAYTLCTFCVLCVHVFIVHSWMWLLIHSEGRRLLSFGMFIAFSFVRSEHVSSLPSVFFSWPVHSCACLFGGRRYLAIYCHGSEATRPLVRGWGRA